MGELQQMAAYDEDMLQLTPRQWFDRTLHEADLAVLAERRGKREEMFVAYMRCCSAYMNAKMHPQSAAERKSDAHWAQRLKGFKEVCQIRGVHG